MLLSPNFEGTNAGLASKVLQLEYKGAYLTARKTETIVPITLAKKLIDCFFIDNNYFTNLFRFFSFCGVTYVFIHLQVFYIFFYTYSLDQATNVLNVTKSKSK